MRKVDLPVGHEVVNSHELATLRRKARAHDAYLWATRHMADNARELTIPQWVPEAERAYKDGYADSLRDFAQLVKEAPLE